MFTGLIECVGELTKRAATARGLQLQVASSLAGELRPGDSVAVNGVCLTVSVLGRDTFDADVGPETRRVTTMGELAHGSLVNLERPLRADGRLGGHFVQGHVDGVGRVEALRADADFHWLRVAFPAALAPLIVLKGSIAVDGISLTVARLDDTSFDAQVVPYTLEHTNLKSLAAADRVNLECDMVGKYVARAIELAGLAVGERNR